MKALGSTRFDWWRVALGLLCAWLVACTASNSTLPNAARLDQYSMAAARLFYAERKLLDEGLAAGKLTAEAHKQGVAELQQKIDTRARETAWTRHAMAEEKRKIQGIPTPDAPVSIGIPQSGAETGSLPTQGTYRRFNQTDLGSTAVPIAREFFRGYQPGGSVRGNSGRSL
jgi:hypothetical protein